MRKNVKVWGSRCLCELESGGGSAGLWYLTSAPYSAFVYVEDKGFLVQLFGLGRCLTGYKEFLFIYLFETGSRSVA